MEHAAALVVLSLASAALFVMGTLVQVELHIGGRDDDDDDERRDPYELVALLAAMRWALVVGALHSVALYVLLVPHTAGNGFVFFGLSCCSAVLLPWARLCYSRRRQQRQHQQ